MGEAQRWSDLPVICSVFQRTGFWFIRLRSTWGHSPALRSSGPQPPPQPKSLGCEAQKSANLTIPWDILKHAEVWERPWEEMSSVPMENKSKPHDDWLPCLPFPGKGLDTGFHSIVTWGAFKKGHITKWHSRPRDTDPPWSGLGTFIFK